MTRVRKDSKERIIPCSIAHAELISALHGQCFDEPWGADTVGGILAMPGVIGFVACTDDEPDGFLLARLAADECEILSLGVVPARRRTGHGGRLVAAVLDKASGAGAHALYLEVAETNGPARALYEKYGFVVAGKRKEYYRKVYLQAHEPPTDGLILRRRIEPSRLS